MSTETKKITKPLGIGAQRALLVTLRQVVADAKMDRAGFNYLASEGPFPTTEAEVTEFIKQRTRPYRESWIIAPLEEAIREIEEGD
jgi:hypothetical protein